MSTHRIVLTASPSAAAVEKSRTLLTFAALTGAGHEATARGVYEPAAVTRRAEALVAAWVYDVRCARPMDERTARMLAAALDLAGVPCCVEPAS